MVGFAEEETLSVLDAKTERQGWSSQLSPEVRIVELASTKHSTC